MNIDLLKQYDLFGSLSNTLLEEISQHFKTSTYPVGYIIFSERDPSFDLYLLSTGVIQISAENKQGSFVELVQLSEGIESIDCSNSSCTNYFLKKSTSREKKDDVDEDGVRSLVSLTRPTVM